MAKKKTKKKGSSVNITINDLDKLVEKAKSGCSTKCKTGCGDASIS